MISHKTLKDAYTISEKAWKDINKVFAAGFVPGSTVSMADIAVDHEVGLVMSRLPVDTAVDIGLEVCGDLGAPLFESDAMAKAA